MVTAISPRRSRPRLGPVANLAAATRGLALAGLVLAELGLLAVLFTALGLTAAGFGVLIAGNGDPVNQRVLLGLLAIGAGLGIGWSVGSGTLLAIRRLASTTRRLAGEWCGVPIAEPYLPLPAGDRKLSFAERLSWLLKDPATWRDLLWVMVNLVVGWLLAVAGQIIDTDPAAARALLVEARDASVKALAELRDLIRGIHPPVLADRGLADAIRALALDSPMRIHLASDLEGRPPAPVESAAYFAVSELLANVSKHAEARQTWIDIRHTDGMLRIGVTDNGHGGADPDRGSGLRGVERRLAPFDGVLAVSSPPGGPTAVTMEIPCASSSCTPASCWPAAAAASGTCSRTGCSTAPSSWTPSAGSRPAAPRWTRR